MQDSVQSATRWSDRRLNQAVGWVHRRGASGGASPQSMRVLDTEPGETAILGQWSGLATSVAGYAAAAGGLVGGQEMLGVLRAVSGSVDAQEQLLRAIDSKLDALVKGPFNTGITHLREAERVEGDPDVRLEHIKQAKDCFYLAHGQAASLQSRAVVEFHLGVVWLLLGRPDDAIHWMTQSHASCVVVATELARQTKQVKVLQSQAGTAAAAAFYPAGIVVLGMKFKSMLAAQRAREMLLDFLPFLECVARSRNLLAGNTVEPLPALALLTHGENTYELVPTATQ